MESALLLFLSPLRNSTPEYYTGLIPGLGTVSILGAETNDAPCKFLFHQAAANRDRINTVLCLVSEDVNKADASGISAFTRFRDVIIQHLKESDDPMLKLLYQEQFPRFVAIPYDFDPDNGDALIPVENRPTFIYRHIAQSVSRQQFCQLYVDYTGGFRDASFLLTELSRFLSFIDVPCKKIVYSNHSEKRILSLQGAYEMFPILSGINSFINTGNAVGLQNAYRIHSSPLVDSLLENMTKFARAVSVCAISELEEIWAAMDRSIQALEEHVPTDEADITLLMLRDLLPKIRAKFKMKPGSSAPSYIPLIRWCLDNEMLQQAMTLFSERVPEICFKNGILTEYLYIRSKKNREKKATELKSWVDDYPYAFHSYLYNYIAADPSTIDFAKYCRTLCQNLNYRKLLDHAVERTNTQEWFPSTRKASIKLVKFIKSNFDSRTLAVSSPSAMIYSKSLLDYGDDLPSFLKAIADEDTRMAADYFVHNDYSRFNSIAQLREQSLKRCALEVLNRNMVDVSDLTCMNCRQLAELLQHCYIIRLLRNQINHASEEDQDDYQYFINQGLFSRQASLYELSRDALIDALNFLELWI